jgi:hypothetical protein
VEACAGDGRPDRDAGRCGGEPGASSRPHTVRVPLGRACDRGGGRRTRPSRGRSPRPGGPWPVTRAGVPRCQPSGPRRLPSGAGRGIRRPYGHRADAAATAGAPPDRIRHGPARELWDPRSGGPTASSRAIRLSNNIRRADERARGGHGGHAWAT